MPRPPSLARLAVAVYPATNFRGRRLSGEISGEHYLVGWFPSFHHCTNRALHDSDQVYDVFLEDSSWRPVQLAQHWRSALDDPNAWASLWVYRPRISR
jgi:hypothetical protein